MNALAQARMQIADRLAATEHPVRVARIDGVADPLADGVRPLSARVADYMVLLELSGEEADALLAVLPRLAVDAMRGVLDAAETREGRPSAAVEPALMRVMAAGVARWRPLTPDDAADMAGVLEEASREMVANALAHPQPLAAMEAYLLHAFAASTVMAREQTNPGRTRL